MTWEPDTLNLHPNSSYHPDLARWAEKTDRSGWTEIQEPIYQHQCLPDTNVTTGITAGWQTTTMQKRWGPAIKEWRKGSWSAGFQGSRETIDVAPWCAYWGTASSTHCTLPRSRKYGKQKCIFSFWLIWFTFWFAKAAFAISFSIVRHKNLEGF